MKQSKIKNFMFCKTILLLAIFGFSFCVQAQVTIGSGIPPHMDALLDLKENNAGSSTKGLLLPRVLLRATDDPYPLTTNVEGMFVYNTATAGTGEMVVVPGVYHNDGSKWVRGASSGAWLLGGNAGTDPATNFLGTTDNQPLVFRVNNVRAGYIGTSNSAIGLNTLSFVK